MLVLQEIIQLKYLKVFSLISAGFIIVKKFGINFFYLTLITWSGSIDIPKGKCEINEIKIDCALRELKEETNISIDDISILNFISHNKDLTLFLAILESNKKVKINYNPLSNLLEHYDYEWNNFKNLKEVSPKRFLLHLNLSNKFLKENQLE